MAHLYEITSEYEGLLQALEDPELESETLEGVVATLDGIEEEFGMKACKIARMVRNLEHELVGVKGRIEGLTARKKQLEGKVEWLKRYLTIGMKTTGIPKATDGEISIRYDAGKPSVKIDDEALIPARLFVTPEPPEPRPDKKAILAALEAGELIPGASIERNPFVVIKG